MTFIIDLALQLGAVTLLGAVAFRMKALDLGGLLAAIPMGFVIVVTGGWAWLVAIVAFLSVAAVFTALKYDYKRSLGYAQGKGGARGWANILANGLVPALAAAAGFYTHSSIFATVFIGALATALADTLATEVGLLSRVKPRLITNLRQTVQPGTSGGVTPLGELMSFAGSVLIGLLAVLLRIGDGGYPLRVLLIGTISGFMGSTVDSLIGATIQGLNRCNVCQAVTESLRHHGVPTSRIRGLRLVENNVVNFVSIAAGAFVAVVLQII